MNELSRTSAPAKAPLWRRAWVVGIVAGLLGLLAGAAVAFTDVTKSREYLELAADRDEVATQRDRANDERDQRDDELERARSELEDMERSVQEALGEIPAREEAVTAREKELGKRQREIAALEKQVARREKAVGLVEREIEANTVPGEGLYEVGRDLKAGTYRSSGSSDCYYAVLNSPDTGDIATNNLTDGPAIISLRAGTYFDTSGCAEWVLQR